MDIKKLKRDELLKLKSEIESQLKDIEILKKQVVKEKSNDKTKLSHLEKDDKIFCINFRGSEIYHIDYVKINLYKKDEEGYEECINYSSSHNTKPMGCSSCFNEYYMDKHYFLVIFPSSMYFFTLKPESWQDDIKLALDFQIKLKKRFFDKEINGLKLDVKNLISKNDINDLLI